VRVPTPKKKTKAECKDAEGTWDPISESFSTDKPTVKKTEAECTALGVAWNATSETCTSKPTPAAIKKVKKVCKIPNFWDRYNIKCWTRPERAAAKKLC